MLENNSNFRYQKYAVTCVKVKTDEDHAKVNAVYEIETLTTLQLFLGVSIRLMEESFAIFCKYHLCVHSREEDCDQVLR